MPWADAPNRESGRIRVHWYCLYPHQTRHRLPWADAPNRDSSRSRFRWQYPPPHNVPLRLPFGDYAQHLEMPLRLRWAYPQRRSDRYRLRWGPSGSHNFAVIIPWSAEPPAGTGGGTITVPVQDVYTMQPNITVTRVSDGKEIDVLSASVSMDSGSWAFTAQFQMPFDNSAGEQQLPLFDPAGSSGPTALQIDINGYSWIVVVDGYTDNRKFGARSLTVNCSARTVLLADPWAPKRSYVETADRDASQLAQQEVSALGWTVDWLAVDWLVPGGTWSYQDLSPMGVIASLAGKIGATVLTDPTLETIKVQNSYIVSPWDWSGATPYAEIPSSVITQVGGNWRGGSNANGIYVYAQNNAFGALVKITGSDGATQLPMIVDPLLIDADPARERGRVELARAGKTKPETRTIPLFPDPDPPGLIPIGVLLEVTESTGEIWRGVVTGNTISGTRAGSALSVRQTLSIERQYW